MNFCAYVTDILSKNFVSSEYSSSFVNNFLKLIGIIFYGKTFLYSSDYCEILIYFKEKKINDKIP